MSPAPVMPLLDWPRHEAVRQLEARRRRLIAELARAKPRTERYLGLRAQIRALTEEELRLETQIIRQEKP